MSSLKFIKERLRLILHMMLVHFIFNYNIFGLGAQLNTIHI